MKRYVSFRLFSVCALALALLVGSCRKNAYGPSASSPHSIRVFLTDDPALTFDKVLIDIQKLEIKVEDSAQNRQENEDESGSDSRDRQGMTSGGWMTLNIQPGVYDLLQFRNGLDTLFSTGSFPPLHTLRKIRLTLGPDDSVVVNGISTPVFLGNNNIVVIKLTDDFLSDDPADFDLTLDFDAGNSIRMKGSRLELDPRIRPFRKDRTGGIEGRVAPAAAMPVVMVMGATDTATAKPDEEGEFKVEGLKPGSYSLLVHATMGNYVDTTLQNITISGKEDIEVGQITLHL